MSNRSVNCLLLVLVALALVLGTPASSQRGYTEVDVFEAFAFETIDVGTAVVAFTAATYAPTGQITAKKALCSVETAGMRYRYDGGSPTTSVGHAVAAAGSFAVYGSNIGRIKMVRSSGSNAAVSCSYLR